MTKREDTKSLRDEHAEETRLALLAAAQTRFASAGFQASSIEEIARSARVTRGAFYHHFADKRAMFDAVVVSLQQDAVRKIEERTLGMADLWDRLMAGVDAYLDLTQSPAYLRIVVVEGPGVLGPARYREIDDAHPVGLVIASLKALKKRGLLASSDPELLARMVSAMACEAATLMAGADNPAKLKKDVGGIVHLALKPFRKD